METCSVEIIVGKKYWAGLWGLSGFSHIIVVLSFNRPLPTKLGISTAKLLEIDGNTLRVSGLDALQGKPILDIKPLILLRDSQKRAKVPAPIGRELAENMERRVR